MGAAYSLKEAEQVQDRVNYWERKLKYARTMLDKYKKKLKYHITRAEKIQQEQAAKPQGMTPQDFYKLAQTGDQES